MSQNKNNNNYTNNKLPTFCENPNVDVDWIQRLIVLDGYDINERDGMNRSSIHWACENNNLLLVQLLLEYDVMINVVDNYDITPLYWSCLHNNMEIIKLLFERNVDVTLINPPRYWDNLQSVKTSAKKSALLWACHHKNIELISLLLEKGANANGTHDRDGYSPLIWSIKNNQCTIIELLIDKGRANINNIHDNCGQIPLHEALRYSKQYHNINMMQILINKGANINNVDSVEVTALHVACGQNGNLDIVKFLISNRASIIAVDNQGFSALHYATKHFNNIDIVRYLIEVGANIHKQDYNGIRPLYYACHYCDNVNVIELLLDHGAKIQDLYRHNELIQRKHLILASDINFDNIRTLLRRGFHFISIFHEAYQKNYTIREKIVDNTLPDDIAVNMVDHDGNTPLHYAVILHANDKIRTLVQTKNVLINATNNKGETPLYLAAKYHNNKRKHIFTEIQMRDDEEYDEEHDDTSTIRLLLSLNSNINIPDADGTLPMEIAKFMGIEMNISIMKEWQHKIRLQIFSYLKNKWISSTNQSIK